MTLHQFDLEQLNDKKLVCGIDEVGRGPLAGPVVVAACVLDRDFYHPEIKDSKLLSSKKREELSNYIIENAVSYSIVLREAIEIDKIGVSEAVKECMFEAFDFLKVKPDITIVDYVKIDLPKSISIKKGDQKSQAVAAASIIAKVYRDKLMDYYDKIYNGYGFSNNKGYGTKEHYAALKKMGSCKIHRKKFNLHLGG